MRIALEWNFADNRTFLASDAIRNRVLVPPLDPWLGGIHSRHRSLARISNLESRANVNRANSAGAT